MVLNWYLLVGNTPPPNTISNLEIQCNNDDDGVVTTNGMFPLCAIHCRPVTLCPHEILVKFTNKQGFKYKHNNRAYDIMTSFPHLPCKVTSLAISMDGDNSKSVFMYCFYEINNLESKKNSVCIDSTNLSIDWGLFKRNFNSVNCGISHLSLSLYLCNTDYDFYDALAQCSTLTHLDLDTGNEKVLSKLICKALLTLTKLNVLSLRVDFTSEVDSLANCLQICTNLTNLSFHGRMYDDVRHEIIANGIIKNTSLACLSIRCSLKCAHIIIKQCSNLSNFDWQIDDDWKNENSPINLDVFNLNSSLTNLHLDTPTEPCTVYGLKYNTTLKILKIGTSVNEQFYEELAGNTTLNDLTAHSLQFENNRKLLGKVLTQNSTLTKLDMVVIVDFYKTSFFKALRHNMSIQCLSLQQGIDELGVEVLARKISQNHLTSLEIREDSRIGGSRKLMPALCRNTSLTNLGISLRKLSHTAMDQFLDYIKHTQSLTSLTIWNYDNARETRCKILPNLCKAFYCNTSLTDIIYSGKLADMRYDNLFSDFAKCNYSKLFFSYLKSAD